MGGVSFADDIKLLTSTHKGLNKLIYICEQYAAEFDVKTSMIIAAESSFWKSFNLFMANFSQSYSIVKNKLLSSTVVLFMVPHCGLLMIFKK